MTSLNWYDQAPYGAPVVDQFGGITRWYDIPRILKKVKEIEQEREYHINCRNCGASTSFSPNDLNPHQQVDNE